MLTDQQTYQLQVNVIYSIDQEMQRWYWESLKEDVMATYSITDCAVETLRTAQVEHYIMHIYDLLVKGNNNW